MIASRKNIGMDVVTAKVLIFFLSVYSRCFVYFKKYIIWRMRQL